MFCLTVAGDCCSLRWLIVPGQNDMSPTNKFQPAPNKRESVVLAMLFSVLLVLTVVSMTASLANYLPGHSAPWYAGLAMLPLLLYVPLFQRASFTFGYFLGINFYCIAVGFIWLNYQSTLNYDHLRAGLSAAASLLLLLLPLLFQVKPLRSPFRVSAQMMDRLLLALLAFAAAVLAWNAYYGFAFVDVTEADQLRNIVRPAILKYINGSLVNSVLPFAFAWFATRRRYGWAALSVFLISAFYPVLLNKTVAFAGIWLIFLFTMFRLFESKRASLLVLLVPMSIGLMAYQVMYQHTLLGMYSAYFFGIFNYRMTAIPAIVLERYFEFFANHQFTHFCQVGLVRALVGCPYEFQLGAELEKVYHLGNLNGSLLATEGVASVGPLWAPISALICGLVLSLGNSVSAGLPRPLIAASSGLVVLALLNVPLSVSLLSNGLFALLALWFVTPTDIEPEKRS
jgi:hypothetical protein